MANSDEPAFARPRSSVTLGCEEQKGLSKREYFAAIALQGILSNNGIATSSSFKEHCEDAIKHADELLKQLETK